jgi:hypothetical protein
MSENSTNFDVFAHLDPTNEPDNSTDTGLYLTFTGAKVQLDSIAQIIKAVNTVNSKIASDDPELIRKWVHIIQKTHPLVDDGIKDLEFFESVSENIGSTYLLHTKDTQTLSLEDWPKSKAFSVRSLLEFKMDPKAYEGINNAYDKLNVAMTNNISTEFFYERSDSSDPAVLAADLAGAQRDVNINNALSKVLNSNDFHIAGDYTFYDTHLSGLESALMAALTSFMGDAAKLINWLYPVNNIDTACIDGPTISVEGNEVSVDLKGNKVGVIATIIDTTPITIQ